MLFGILAGIQYLVPDFLYGVLDFNVDRMAHINAMVVWMLMGFIGSVYWLLEDEAGTPMVGLKVGELIFYVLTGAVTVVVLVYLFVQTGPGDDTTRWLINEGREYIEAPRWVDIGIVVAVLTFFFNVVATVMKGRATGITGVLIADLLAIGAGETRRAERPAEEGAQAATASA